MDTHPGPKEAFGCLSVIIPAYNAEDVVCATLDSVITYLEHHNLMGEVIVVDDGSTDKTAIRVEDYGKGVSLLRMGRNRGKGCAVRAGMLASQYPWALFMDADNATRIDHLDRFALRASDSDVMIGSRRVAGSRIIRQQPLLRQMLGRSFPHVVRLLTLSTICDTQCGFKLFRRETINEVFRRQRCAGFCFDIEILLIASRLGYRITEMPVDWDNPVDTTLRLWGDPAMMMLDLFRIVWRHRRSQYPSHCPPNDND